MSECETEESDWTSEKLLKLFAAMKSSIQIEDRIYPYTRGMEAMNWENVAFPPFSPEACREKWGEILEKMRKIRTMTELIDEAEETISHPKKRKEPRAKKYQNALEHSNTRMDDFRKEQCHKPVRYRSRTGWKRKGVSTDTSEGDQSCAVKDDLPHKPPSTAFNLFCKEQVESISGVSKHPRNIILGQRWRELTEKERDEYSTRCRQLRREFSICINDYGKTMDKAGKKQMLHELGIKKIRIPAKHVNNLPGEPKMPPRGSHLIFFQEEMKRLKKEFPNSKERFAKISHRWNKLSNEEKESYRKKVNENVRKYSVELLEWFQTMTPQEQEDYLKENPAKRKYLDVSKVKATERKEVSNMPSDSEDEDLEDSSSEREQQLCEENEEDEEEEEEEEDIMFNMF